MGAMRWNNVLNLIRHRGKNNRPLETKNSCTTAAIRLPIQNEMSSINGNHTARERGAPRSFPAAKPNKTLPERASQVITGEARTARYSHEGD
jgi:hypothetical protein